MSIIINKPLKIKIAAIGMAKARIVISSKFHGESPPIDNVFKIPNAKKVNKIGNINVKLLFAKKYQKPLKNKIRISKLIERLLAV